jgi:hypothetical protein
MAVEQQDIRGVNARTLELRHSGDRRTISRPQGLTVQPDLPASHAQVCAAARFQAMLDHFSLREKGGVHQGVLMSGNGAFAVVRGSEQLKPSAPLFDREVPLAIGGIAPALVGQEPNLEQVYGLVG